MTTASKYCGAEALRGRKCKSVRGSAYGAVGAGLQWLSRPGRYSEKTLREETGSYQRCSRRTLRKGEVSGQTTLSTVSPHAALMQFGSWG
ncbi:hypothetical protein SKAU_G00168680 [Synaphobranchus kaupii]|uniref:Uncharacterized protein n=1 Tax=Synaphobranchus kaupii TaxID=118154 RepID=A0A9Q1FK77_SYNKA|nr:hypothetical protein SKAU_G00168680 [Synaphobranchus kaupii]